MVFLKKTALIHATMRQIEVYFLALNRNFPLIVCKFAG